MATNPYLDTLNLEEQRVRTTDSATGAPPKNPYLDTLEADEALRRAQSRATLRTAAAVNPDEAAKASKLAASRGLPEDVVLRNLQDVQMQDAVERADARLQTSPALAAKMRDLPFARVAHDNVENLSAIEHAVGFLRAVPAGAARGVGSLVSGAGEMLDIGARNLDRVYRGVFGDKAADMLWFDLGPKANAALNPAAALKTGGTGWKMIADVVGPDTKNFVTDVGEGIGQLFQQIVVQLATGGSASLFSLYSQGVDAMAEKTAGDSAPQAAKDAAMLAGGAATAVSEKLGVDALLNRVPPKIKNDALRWIVDKLTAAGIEASTEIAEGVLQDVVRKTLTDPDALIGENVAYEAGVAGTAAAVVRAALGVRARGARQAVQQERVEQDAKSLTDLLKLAEKDKLRERDPQAFAALVQASAEQHGSPAEVFIDAKALVETLSQSGMTPEQVEDALPSAKAQLAEALTAGGDVAVPVGEFTALVAGSGLEQALVKHARLSPDALSQEDAKLLAKVDLKAETDKALAQQEVAAEGQAVRAQVLDQLTTAGRFTPAVNAAYADGVMALYETQAARLGVSVAEFAKQYPLNVTAQIAPGASLEQGGLKPGYQSLTLGDTTVEVSVSEGYAQVSMVSTPTEKRGQGSARAAMQELVRMADERGLALFLTAEPMDRKTSKAKLESFYKSLGFTPNKGRNRDFRAQAGMVRQPQALQQDTPAGWGSVGPGDSPNNMPPGTLTKGTFSPSTNTIALLAKADLSTFNHELGHFYLEMLADMAAQPNAPTSVVEDMSKVLEWFGWKGTAAEWAAQSIDKRRDDHENFARGYEAYLLEGKAPSTALARTFQRFSEWMRRIYKTVRSLNVEINDDIRRVYDRMLASEEAIKEAEAARAYAPLFADEKTLKEAGVDPAAYHALGAEATAEAVDQLQARSMRDMRWLSNAKNKALKALQKDAAEKRKVIEAQVREEVGRQPVYAAENFLRRGALPEGDRTNAQRKALDATQGMNTKLDLAVLKEMYGDAPAAPWRYLATGKTGLATTKDGLHPDIVADIFGFPSGDALVRNLLAAEPQAQVTEGMTDQRMLEEHGELSSPEALERAAEQAIRNEARGKFIATELAALNKALGPVRVLVTAAKQFAESVIGRKTLTDIKPHVFAAAETRAAKMAEKLLGKSTEEAATAKRNQLLNHYAARYAHDAVGEIAKVREFFARVANTPDDRLKTRDMDVVNAARAVLAAYGVGRRGEAAAEYLKKVAAYDPDMSQVLQGAVDAALQNAKPLDELTLDELRALNDEVASLWHLAKRSRQMEVDGDLMDREEVQDALKDRLTEIGIPDTMPGDTSAITPAEQRLAKFKTYLASARRTESWVGAMDGADSGVFRSYIWQPVKEAADAYRTDKARLLKRFRELLDPIRSSMRKRIVDAPELGYTFGKDTGGVALNEILHAVLHTGNSSNKRKLLLGRKWATELPDGTLDTSRWDAFIKRMADEGVLTKAHFDFVQGVWDLLEETKPLAQKTHRDVFGKYFAEVTAEPVDTPFGQYAGGYVPAQADPRVVSDAKTRTLMEEENASMAFAFPATARGFTKGRVEYNRPLTLDLATLAQHIDKVLLFGHMERPIRDVRRVLTSKGVAYGVNRIDPAAFDAIISPWLNRAARQTVTTPSPGHWQSWRLWSTLRNRAGMAAMFGNVVNAAQQITGFSIAAVKVRPKHLLGAMAHYAASPRQLAQDVVEASPYMAGRISNEVAAMNDAIKDILINPGLYEQTQQWTMRHAYFMQSAVDNVMSPIIWIAARNQALEQGQDEREAGRFADATVRQTQGSTLPEDISNWEGGSSFSRMFSQFAGYFNMQANLLGTEFQTISRDMGLRKGAGRGLYVLTLAFLVPAWVSEIIVQAFRGGPDDEDKDGEYLDDWLQAVFGMATLRGATAMVPIFGQGANALVNAGNSKPYDDRLATSPAISMVEAAVKAPWTLYAAMFEDGDKSKAVKDVASLISLTTGVPANIAARPLSYAADVQEGDVAPTGPVDMARGLVTGRASPASR